MGSRRILGHALGTRHDAELACGALVMAAAVRGGKVAGVVFHSDQGSEYTSARFRQACERLGVRQSMGRPGSAPATAGSGSWHSTLEFELRSLHKFATRAAARAAVAAWIEDYNHVRRHSALGMSQPGGLRAGPGGNGRRVTVAGPLRGPDKGGGCAAAVLAAPAKRTGPPPRPPGCCASPCGRRPCGPP